AASRASGHGLRGTVERAFARQVVPAARAPRSNARAPGLHTRRPVRVRSDDDAADDLACFHRAERLVHLVELDLARDHVARVEPPRLDELDEALEVAPHLRRAVLAAED